MVLTDFPHGEEDAIHRGLHNCCLTVLRKLSPANCWVICAALFGTNTEKGVAWCAISCETLHLCLLKGHQSTAYPSAPWERVPPGAGQPGFLLVTGHPSGACLSTPSAATEDDSISVGRIRPQWIRLTISVCILDHHSLPNCWKFGEIYCGFGVCLSVPALLRDSMGFNKGTVTGGFVLAWVPCPLPHMGLLHEVLSHWLTKSLALAMNPGNLWGVPNFSPKNQYTLLGDIFTGNYCSDDSDGDNGELDYVNVPAGLNGQCIPPEAPSVHVQTLENTLHLLDCLISAARKSHHSSKYLSIGGSHLDKIDVIVSSGWRMEILLIQWALEIYFLSHTRWISLMH